MTTIWDLLRESVILQGALTIGLWGVAAYLMICGRPIPDLLAAGCGAVITFWFTSKTTRSVATAIKESMTPSE
jgi:hypothetical protein